MKHLRLLALLFIATAASAAETPKFTPPPIQVPDGYTVEFAAAPPLVAHPMMAGFDDRGRLYIAEAAGLNLQGKDLDAKLPNFIRLIEDTDDDGVFDKSTIFADKMTFPMGALWHDGSLYVASSGGVWKLTDTDNDGVADKRELLVTKFEYNGVADDVHGCFLAPDGRIWFVDGIHGHEVRDKEGKVISRSKVGGVFSMKPDGSDFRRHAAGGFNNPVELIFTPEGEPLGTVNIFSQPPRSDCLVHWQDGGVYPREDKVGNSTEFRRTGPLLNSVYNYGHVALSGLCRYDGNALGDFDGDLFVTYFNAHQVVRTSVARSGATFTAQPPVPFLSSTSVDFHPTDVLEDADGSLLVIDTGGWFRIGCPVSQVAKPDIPGAIYRIRKVGAKQPEDPRGLKLDWPSFSPAQLVPLLDDARSAVRQRATATLAKRGDAARTPLKNAMENPSERLRRNAVWTLARLGGSEPMLLGRLSDLSPSVRLAAARSLSQGPPVGDIDELITRLNDDMPEIRREAAAALGRSGKPAAVRPLINALRGNASQPTPERSLEHAVLFALMELNQPIEVAKFLGDSDPRLVRAALIVLDQVGDQTLTQQTVASHIRSNDETVREAALAAALHRGWINLITSGLEHPASESGHQMLRQTVRQYGGNAQVQQAITRKLNAAQSSASDRIAILESLTGTRWKRSDELLAAVGAQLASADESVSLQAAITAGALPGKFDAQLKAIGEDAKRPRRLRLAAFEALARRGVRPGAESVAMLVKCMGVGVPASERLSAARAIEGAKLEAEDLALITSTLSNAGPLEAPSLMRAFRGGSDAKAGMELVAGLERSPGFKSISASELREVTATYPQTVRDAAAILIQKLSEGTASRQKRLDELEALVAKGRTDRGIGLFQSTKGACAACHRVGVTGIQIGPDLSKIGASRSSRDLLEAIVYPSASFGQGYEPMTITLRDGGKYVGFIARESADAIEVRIGAAPAVRLARADIKSIESAAVSVMPVGFDGALTPEELADLVAYLKSLK